MDYTYSQTITATSTYTAPRTGWYRFHVVGKGGNGGSGGYGSGREAYNIFGRAVTGDCYTPGGGSGCTGAYAIHDLLLDKGDTVAIVVNNSYTQITGPDARQVRAAAGTNGSNGVSVSGGYQGANNAAGSAGGANTNVVATGGNAANISGVAGRATTGGAPPQQTGADANAMTDTRATYACKSAAQGATTVGIRPIEKPPTQYPGNGGSAVSNNKSLGGAGAGGAGVHIRCYHTPPESYSMSGGSGGTGGMAGVVIEISANQPPTVPGSITVPDTIRGGNTVAISWTASTDPDNDLAGYRLERSENGGAWGQIYQGTGTSHSDTVKYGLNTIAYRVKAYDKEGLESDYKTSATKTVVNNEAPVISGSNTHLGTFGESGPAYGYTVTDDLDATLTVVERLDGGTLRSYTATAGQQNNLSIAPERWRQVLNGAHTLTVTATDSHGESTVRTLQFGKDEPVYQFETLAATAEDKRPSLLAMSMVHELPEGAEVEFLACNNGLDAEPAWEDITNAVKMNTNYILQNTGKQAGQWAVRFRITCDRKDGVGDCYASAITYAYRTGDA